MLALSWLAQLFLVVVPLVGHPRLWVRLFDSTSETMTLVFNLATIPDKRKRACAISPQVRATLVCIVVLFIALVCVFLQATFELEIVVAVVFVDDVAAAACAGVLSSRLGRLLFAVLADCLCVLYCSSVFIFLFRLWFAFLFVLCMFSLIYSSSSVVLFS